ncbi:hypothetical protein ACVXHB_04845 [Escherichia coli]
MKTHYQNYCSTHHSWALALTQFGGTKYTARIAKVGFFAGILLPAFILIALAAIYLPPVPRCYRNGFEDLLP